MDPRPDERGQPALLLNENTTPHDPLPSLTKVVKAQTGKKGTVKRRRKGVGSTKSSGNGLKVITLPRVVTREFQFSLSSNPLLVFPFLFSPFGKIPTPSLLVGVCNAP